MSYEYKTHFRDKKGSHMCGHAVWSENMILTTDVELVTCRACLRCMMAKGIEQTVVEDS